MVKPSSKCIHHRSRCLCKFCSINILCTCGSTKKICRKCIANKICNHNLKRSRCKFCNTFQKKILRLCDLNDYQQGIYQNEKCCCYKCNPGFKICSYCENENIPKKENWCTKCQEKFNQYSRFNSTLCCFCNINKKEIGDRCKNCFNKYNQNIISEQIKQENLKFIDEIRKRETNRYIQDIYKQSTKTTAQLLDEIGRDINKVLYIKRSINFFENILALINNNFTINKFEESLRTFFRRISNTNKTSSKFTYQIKLIICNKYSSEFKKILDKCLSHQSLFYGTRIIFLFINNNTIVTKELIRDSNIKQCMIKLLSSDIADRQIISFIKEIIEKIEILGF